MAAEQTAFQITYASVESPDGGDPTATAERILRDQRVLAARRDFDGDETVLMIPITEQDDIVALDDKGLLRFDLSAHRLIELFEAEGLVLHLAHGDEEEFEEVDAELDEQFGAAFEELDDSAASPDDLAGFGMSDDEDDEDDLFQVEPVRVAEFSRRGPWAARATAQLLGTDVDYLEAGTWSVYNYRTGQPHVALTNGRADLPVIEVNRPENGGDWVEVTAPNGATAMVWPNAEQHTRPVLDLDAIETPESAEVYLRMLMEADGIRDELIELGMGAAIDLDAAHRACLPESLGGVVGADERLRAFVAAFDVPVALIEAGLGEQTTGRRFVARGWGRTLVDFFVAGMGETTALTRRDRPVARFSRFVRKRPLVGISIAVAELAAGVAFARTRSRLGRGMGILLIVDAIADLAIWVVRLRRRR